MSIAARCYFSAKIEKDRRRKKRFVYFFNGRYNKTMKYPPVFQNLI